MKSLKYLAWTATGLVGLGLGANSVADDKDEEAAWSGTLDTIVVTAERREQRLQDVPLAVTALTDSTLADRQIVDPQGLERAVPGMILIENVSAPTNFSVALRGSVQQDAALVVAESPVGFYLDDVYLARLTGLNTQFLDIERVEVLRGPQGTLYGRNTLAGAVKFISRQPGFEPEFRGEAGYGSFGSYRLGASVSGPLGQSDTRGSLALMANGTDGFIFNQAIDQDVRSQRNWGMRGRLLFEPTAALSVTTTVSYTDSRNDGWSAIPAMITTDNPRFSSGDLQPVFGVYDTAIPRNPDLPPPLSPLPTGDTHQWIASLALDYQLDGSTLRSITAHVSTDDYFANEFTGLGFFPGANGSETRQWSQEFQWLGAAGAWNWIAGLYGFRETADQFIALVTDDVISVATNSFAIYGQVDYAMSERWSVTAGLRLGRDEKDFDGQIRVLGTQEPLSPVYRLSENDTSLTPRLGLEWRPMVDNGPGTDLMIYLSAARGYKAGGFNGIAFGNPDVLQTSYGPETNWTYELGLKAEFLDRRLRTNLVAYYNDISDLALGAQTEGPGGVSFPVQNAGDARIRGLEAEITVAPTRDFQLFTNLTVQRGRYTSLNPASEAAISEALFGSIDIPQLPDYALSAGFTWGFDLPTLGDWARLTLGADAYVTDDFFVAVSNEFRIEGYSRYNAFASLDLPQGLQLRLAGTNLGNSKDFISGIAAFGGYVPLPPREWMLSLSWQHR